MKLDIFHGIPTRSSDEDLSASIDALKTMTEDVANSLSRENFSRGHQSGYHDGMTFNDLFGRSFAYPVTDLASAYWDAHNLFRGLMHEHGELVFAHLRYQAAQADAD